MSSPVIGDDGFFLVRKVGAVRTPNGPAENGRLAGAVVRQPCLLTVPLLCSFAWRRLQVERPHQIERRLARTHLTQGRPQVDHISLLAAGAVEAAEYVLLQVDTERPAPARTVSIG